MFRHSRLTHLKFFRSSNYHAVYLELVLRESLPLATLDRDLKKAAKQADVMLYLAAAK